MNFIKRWLKNRRDEKERIARCEEGRRQSDALVEMLMAGRALAEIGGEDE